MSDSHSMDELPPSGNVMDLLKDEAWLQEAVRLEEEAGVDIGAGPNDGRNLGELLKNPAGYGQFLRVKRLVLRGFKVLLSEGNLGAGTEAAWVCGKPLVMLRLEEPATAIQTTLFDLLDQPGAEAHPMPAETVRVIREVLQTVLLPEDWEAIATAAANAVRQQALRVAA